jgi:hypothetical protein
MKKVGYLFLEMLIAIAMVATFSLIVALLQSHIACWHKEAEQYLNAANIAQKVLAYQQTGMSIPAIPGFTITTNAQSVNPSVACILDTVTVSFVTPHGIRKEVTMVRARLI